MSSTLQEDEISQRIFYGGLLGLPWLWMVHAMGYYSKKRNTDALLEGTKEYTTGVVCVWLAAPASTLLLSLTLA